MDLPNVSAHIPEKDEIFKEKRRSLLPKPGGSRYSIRLQKAANLAEESTDSTENQESVPTASESTKAESVIPDPAPNQSKVGRLRPRSMYQPSTTQITASSRLSESTENASTQRSMRPPAPPNKRAVPTSSSTGLSRSQSLRKPAVVTNPPQPTGPTGHSRTQSTSVLTATTRPVAKTEITNPERPKSLLVAPNSQIKPASGALTSTASQTRSSNRIAAASRTIHTRTKSEATSIGGIQPPSSRIEDAPTARLRKREVATEEPKALSRPAFSTLQQHFTPRKTGKAPTATFLHPTVPQTGQSLPAEVVSLQCELLQLHLLHRSADQTSQQWEKSAKNSLRARFEEIACLYESMLRDEREGQEQKNLQSLLEWSSRNSSIGLVEHIQALSGPLHDLPSLVESGGRLHRLVDEFERWASWVEEVRAARAGSVTSSKASGTIEGLSEPWKSENMALTRKLAAYARDLETLSQPSSGSSISHMVESCKSLLAGILDELQTMQAIEAHVVDSERDWVENQLDHIARGADVVHVDDTRAAAWQS